MIEDDVKIKIALFGSSNVGKTSILRRLVRDDFSDTRATVALDVLLKIYNYYGKEVKVELWDTAGAERFHSLPSNLYRHLQGAILVYDVTNYETFQELRHWMTKLDSHYDKSDHPPIIIVLGNKIDMVDREISREEGLAFANRHRCLFVETSAKTGVGIAMAFEELVTKVMETPNLVGNDLVIVPGSESNHERFSFDFVNNCIQC